MPTVKPVALRSVSVEPLWLRMLWVERLVGMAVKLALRVSLPVCESTAVMVVPAGMPVPVTWVPTLKRLSSAAS